VVDEFVVEEIIGSRTTLVAFNFSAESRCAQGQTIESTRVYSVGTPR
jgi:hypothetical protein